MVVIGSDGPLMIACWGWLSRHRPGWRRCVRAALRALLIVCAADAVADDVAKGLAIAEEAHQRNAGFADYQVSVAMILRHPHAADDERKLRISGIEMAGDGERSLIVFDAPADQRGTALLTYAHGTVDDDQWLFLPALQRVKRIVSTNRAGPFVGSEFAFEDLSAQEVARYAYRYLDQAPFEDARCDRVERVPTYKNSGYSRQIVWYDIAERRTRRVDFYDRRGELLKTYTASGFVRYLDHTWRAGTMHMQNVQTGRSTILVWTGFRFRTGLDAERDFSVTSLRRSR